MCAEGKTEFGPDIHDLKIRLFVYRRLDNRTEGLSDESPRALELHIRRRDALHEVLSGVAGWTVESWGDTDDPQPHELVDLIVAITSNPHFQAAVVSGFTWVSLELVKAGVGEFASEAVRELLARLIPKQKERKILDFSLTLPDGTTIRVSPNADVDVIAGPSKRSASS
jgi:hypothetical protein